jgi:hypothetical protein
MQRTQVKALLRGLILGLLGSTVLSIAVKSTAGEPSPGFDLFVNKARKWSNSTIPVCWENPSNSFTNEMNWVRNAIERSWSLVADINFTGWGKCNVPRLGNFTIDPGIHILISDEHPYTGGLGSDLDKKINGMVLNFTFRNWTGSKDGRELCQNGGRIPRGFNDPSRIPSNSEREFCIRTIAVHEFGHALGFAHEQNRSDTPSTCTEPKQGSDGDILVGPWDLDSVMNYCDGSGNGNLSATDVEGAAITYGFSDKALQIISIYQEILNRKADIEGLKGWLNFMANGASLSEVRRGIATSQEAGLTVNGIYQQVLGRDADPEGLNGWLNFMANGASLSEVRRGIETSPEAQNRRP